ncbi:DPP IV N-terminal domain-containing protein [Salmonirosea aquatica]|uniref:Prolyl oligopeptidase family serine peptidase n=1 Tax=Salmonirosea aquatica TaxID=2654236 RepID=A0A7C9B8V8_9BACT|nr:prolyl oligopeptidase family serine peptidase [Cytophagaceae bacterium SJW1-29]
MKPTLLSTLRSFSLVCILLVACHALVHGQGRLEDYQRAEKLKKQLKDNVYHAPQAMAWSASGKWLWYAIQTPRGKEYMAVNPAKKQRLVAFDHEKLANKLSELTQSKIDPYNLPLARLAYIQDDREIEFRAERFTWTYNLANNSLTKKDPIPTDERRYWANSDDEKSAKPVFSPDSTRTAYIKNHNLYVRTEKTQEESQLSFDGSEGEYYSGYVRWSPDSKKLVTNKIRPNEKHLIYFVRSSPDDQLQPKLENREYLKPGDALPVRRPQLFWVEEKKHLSIDDALFAQQYSLSRMEWREDSRAFTFEYNQRGHQLYRVLEVNAADGTIQPLIEEKSPTFIDYSGKRFRQDIADGKEIIWASERDGWNHLYLYDGTSGQVKNQITRGNWVVRNVIHVDEKKRTILFAAGSVNPQQDPYFVQYFRINFDGSGLTALTTEDANHAATFSPDFAYFVDSYSRVDLPPVTVLRRSTDGSVVMELEKADASEWTKVGWRAPESFVAKGRDGKTDIWGIIIRPTNFDSTKRYPVIENIYAGPHSAFAPKSFMTNNRSMFELAELGFIVVQLDGMGTSQRSKAFHNVCWQNLKDAGLPDRMLWMQAAAKKYPYLDLDRVGIYGTSAGGQSSTGALLFYPDFYKVGVSSCGCHDNRMDKIWWNEQWMGYPIGPHYADCSNVTHAANLKGKLLLILGEVDDNVDPASTMQLVNALVKADKDFDFLMVPNMAHSSGGEYGERKRRDFFVRHLMGVEPPAWTSLSQE